MTDSEVTPRCIAITMAGTRCKNDAIAGSEYCHIHIPATARSANESPGQANASEEELSDRELRERLMAELDSLIARVQAITPEYKPPAFSPERMVKLMDKQADKLPSTLRLGILDRLRNSINEDLLDIETWKGMWYMANYTLEYQSDILKRRMKGEYETDEWGLDWEFVEAVRPFFDFMYKIYWRVETTGIEHIPDYDRALLVSNHSGQLPWDGTMIMAAVLNEHPAQRLVRNLYDSWYPTLPFISSTLVKMGQALGSIENGIRLLEQDELVGAFPEGYKGLSKRFRDRYKLARFERGDFAKMALLTESPIIPVSVVGAEETYVTLANSSTLAKATGFPYFPISFRFPWFGLLGVVPFPTKWYIDFGEPILTDSNGSEEAENLVLVSQLADQVRNIIQEMVNSRLAQRRSLFY